MVRYCCGAILLDLRVGTFLEEVVKHYCHCQVIECVNELPKVVSIVEQGTYVFQCQKVSSSSFQRVSLAIYGAI